MDYEALKKKEEEIRTKREKLLAECEQYEKDIRNIQKEMAKLDHTKLRLDYSNDWMMRQYIDFNKGQDYHDLTFYKYYPRMFPSEKVYHEDSIIKIVQFCEHKSAIISLSDHAFEICCEILGEHHKKYDNDDMDIYTWFIGLRAK